MKRIPEPELMNDHAQALAYARADFSEPHDRFVALFRETFPALDMNGTVLDLGCGPGDISCRFASAYPRCRIHGLDGATAMLDIGRKDIAARQLDGRVELLHCYLPRDNAPLPEYQGVISNSLLHHLDDPMVLWHTVNRYAALGAPVFVMDLLRPSSVDAATMLMKTYASDEPGVLRHDFYHSLLAAYEVEEVAAQLATAGLEELTIQVVSDRHWIAHGRKV